MMATQICSESSRPRNSGENGSEQVPMEKSVIELGIVWQPDGAGDQRRRIQHHGAWQAVVGASRVAGGGVGVEATSRCCWRMTTRRNWKSCWMKNWRLLLELWDEPPLPESPSLLKLPEPPLPPEEPPGAGGTGAAAEIERDRSGGCLADDDAVAEIEEELGLLQRIPDAADGAAEHERGR